MDSDNRKRALTEIVSLDAWHKGFTVSRKAADLHVDVAFLEGRIGGDAMSPVRFRVRLKRAEVVVIVPPTEPAKVDKSSVSRDAPHVKVTIKDSTHSKKSAKAGAKIGAKASAEKIAADVQLEGGASFSALQETTMQMSRESSGMSVTQIMTPDGDYAWAIKPTAPGILEGKPWDAKTKPRLKIIDTRADRAKGIEPTVRVEIRCRREDLEISNIAFKAKRDMASLITDSLHRNRMIAAEAVIRTRLFEAGLIHGDMADPFATITLCATLAEGN